MLKRGYLDGDGTFIVTAAELDKRQHVFIGTQDDQTLADQKATDAARYRATANICSTNYVTLAEFYSL